MDSGRFSDELLERMRGEGDPLADDAVRRIFAERETGSVSELLGRLVANDQLPDPGEWPQLDAYLEQSAKLPPWLDAGAVELAEYAFARWGLLAFAILGCASLPECYVMRGIA